MLGAIVGLPLLWWRTWNVHRQAEAALRQAETATRRHEEQVEADRERRITDSFTRAVEQLGSEQLATRLGAIYALERIAQESPRDHWPIMETLTAYVREQVPWTAEMREEAAEEWAEQTRKVEKTEDGVWVVWVDRRPTTDVQAILTVIGRRHREHDAEGRRTNLGETNLEAVDLSSNYLDKAALNATNLNYANMNRAHLRGAQLLNSHLNGAFLMETHLENAQLFGAHLRYVQAEGVHLEDAKLGRACLRRANLRGAHLTGVLFLEAHLEGADLTDSNITQSQLDEAFTDEKTKVSPGLRTNAPISDHTKGMGPPEGRFQSPIPLLSLWRTKSGSMANNRHNRRADVRPPPAVLQRVCHARHPQPELSAPNNC